MLWPLLFLFLVLQEWDGVPRDFVLTRLLSQGPVEVCSSIARGVPSPGFSLGSILLTGIGIFTVLATGESSATPAQAMLGSWYGVKAAPVYAMCDGNIAEGCFQQGVSYFSEEEEAVGVEAEAQETLPFYVWDSRGMVYKCKELPTSVPVVMARR